MDLNDRYTYKKNRKEIKRIIYIRGLGKKNDKEIVQKVVFVRTLKIDKENNEIVEQSGWTLGDESNGMFPEYIPETYEKKVTKVKKVPAKIITADDVDETVIVKYRSNKKQVTANRLKEKIDRLTYNSATQSKVESSSTTQSESQSEFESSLTTQSKSNSDVNSTSILETQSNSATQSKSESTVNTQSKSAVQSASQSKSSSEKQSQSSSHTESESTYDTAISKDELSSSAKRAMFRRSLRKNFANLGNEKEKKASTEHSQSLSSTTNDYQLPQTTNFLKNNNETKTSLLSTSELQSNFLNKLSTSEVQNGSLNELFTSEEASDSLNKLFTSKEASDTLDSTASSRLESDTSQLLNTSPTPTKKSAVNDWLVDNKAEKKMPTPTTDAEDNLDIITANEETYIKTVPNQTQQDEVVIISNSEKFKKYQKKIFEQEKSKKDFTPRQKVPINFSILTSFLAQNSEILNNSNVYQIGQAFLLAKKWKVELWTK